ncbi:hypothetical protein PYW07_006035 [Mythimna separata]|uniref:Uncharacterized protein n=1 Tax=Mythimna separata TaxID=271217 RepID=A0AAD7YKJ8_MYTSE|nr:hypothetical protein PYW07_006035 [Mythimna separata]
MSTSAVPTDADSTSAHQGVSTARRQDARQGRPLTGRITKLSKERCLAKAKAKVAQAKLDLAEARLALVQSESSDEEDSASTTEAKFYLQGKAKDAVEELLLSADPEDFTTILQAHFRRPELLVQEAYQQLRNLPPLTGSARQLVTFASKISNALVTLQELKCEEHMCDIPVSVLVDKLTLKILTNHDGFQEKMALR